MLDDDVLFVGGTIGELIDDINSHIDEDKQLIKTSHSFEEKLSAMEPLFLHMGMEEHEVFTEISALLIKIREIIEQTEKGHLHFILEYEAGEKRGKKWLLRHQKELKCEAKKLHELDLETLDKIDKLFDAIKSEIMQNLDDEEIRQVLERIPIFILTYQKLFKKELGKRSN